MKYVRLLPLFLFWFSPVLFAAQPIQLAWDPSTDPSVTGYRLYYGVSDGVFDHVVNVGANATCTLTGLTAGQQYFIVVTAVDSSSMESTPSNEVFTVATFQPVQVSFTSPKDGDALNGPRTISVSASASSPDSTVTKVEFFADRHKIGEVTAAPYTLSWANVQPGQHTLFARAWDATGASASTGAISVDIESVRTSSFERRADGSVQFTVQAAAGSANQVYASSDLVNWTLVDSFVNENGTTVIIDPGAANVDRRFYRVQAQ